MFGAEAVELIAANKYGHMVAYHSSQVHAVKITEAVGRLKTVPPTGALARTARALGICLGDYTVRSTTSRPATRRGPTSSRTSKARTSFSSTGVRPG
jgi:hypothetical protein